MPNLQGSGVYFLVRITRYTCHDSLQSLNLTGKTLSLIHIKTLNFDPHFVIRTILHNSKRFLKLLNVNATTTGKTYEFLPTGLPVTRVKFTNKQSFASSLKNMIFLEFGFMSSIARPTTGF